MRRMKFVAKNSMSGVYVSSKKDIIACLGELGYSIESIEIYNNGLVIGYIGGQGVTLGQVTDE